jgi:hypothetical protein
MIKNLAENNLVRFISVTRKKDLMYANFRVKGVKGGTNFSASISVDLSALEIDLNETALEQIIEMSAKLAIKEFQKSEIQFEGMKAI